MKFPVINFFGSEPEPVRAIPSPRPQKEKKPNPLRKFWVGCVMDANYTEDGADMAYAAMLKELGRE